MWGMFKREVPIIAMNMTDKQLYDKLKAKGLRKRTFKNRFGEFSYKSYDYLVYNYYSMNMIQFMVREEYQGRVNYIQFACFYYGNQQLGVSDQHVMNQFMIWLNSPEKARPYSQ